MTLRTQQQAGHRGSTIQDVASGPSGMHAQRIRDRQTRLPLQWQARGTGASSVLRTGTRDRSRRQAVILLAQATPKETPWRCSPSFKNEFSGDAVQLRLCGSECLFVLRHVPAQEINVCTVVLDNVRLCGNSPLKRNFGAFERAEARKKLANVVPRKPCFVGVDGKRAPQILILFLSVAYKMVLIGDTDVENVVRLFPFPQHSFEPRYLRSCTRFQFPVVVMRALEVPGCNAFAGLEREWMRKGTSPHPPCAEAENDESHRTENDVAPRRGGGWRGVFRTHIFCGILHERKVYLKAQKLQTPQKRGVCVQNAFWLHACNERSRLRAEVAD